MNSARASRSAERRNMLRMTATSTNHGEGDPMAAHATPPMKNAGAPSSVSARAAARHTDTYEIRVLEARTTGIRAVGGNLAMRVSFFSLRWGPTANACHLAPTALGAGYRPFAARRASYSVRVTSVASR